MPTYFTPFAPNEAVVNLGAKTIAAAENMAQIERLKQQAQLDAAKLPYAGDYARAGLYGSPFEQQQAERGYGLKASDLELRRLEQQRHNQQMMWTMAHQQAQEKQARDQYERQLAADKARADADERRFGITERRLYNQENQPIYSPEAGGFVTRPRLDMKTGQVTGGQVIPVEGIKGGKQMPIPAQNSLTSASALLSNAVALANDFKPDYAGYAIPGIGETVSALEYLPGVPTNQRDWWKNYESLIEATKRHSLYGGGLTKRELSLSKAGAINPAMQGESVQKYMDARIGMMLTDMSRQTKQLSTSYNPKQIEAATDIPGIHEANLAPKSIDDYASIGKTYRQTGMVGQVHSPRTREELDKLPSGSMYVNPADGQIYRKK